MGAGRVHPFAIVLDIGAYVRRAFAARGQDGVMGGREGWAVCLNASHHHLQHQ